MPTMFVFRVNHILDIITNSSSELFIFRGKSADAVREMIKTVYPDYLNEYEDIKGVESLDGEELENYINRLVDYGVMKEEDFPRGTFSGLETSSFMVEMNRKAIIEAINKHGPTYFLMSLGDNPDFDYQEKLENIAETRIHLG